MQRERGVGFGVYLGWDGPRVEGDSRTHHHLLLSRSARDKGVGLGHGVAIGHVIVQAHGLHAHWCQCPSEKVVSCLLSRIPS